MATPARSSGFFSGLVLLSVGVLLLLHNYGHLDLHFFISRWWPVLIIFWGAIKLYERTAGRRFGGAEGSGITGGEVLLVVGMLALIGIIVGVDYTKEKIGGVMDVGDNFSFDVDVAPKKVPANTRILVHNGRGDITVRGSDDDPYAPGANRRRRVLPSRFRSKSRPTATASKCAQPVMIFPIRGSPWIWKWRCPESPC